MAGIEMDNKKNQPKIEKIQINVDVDGKEEIINKIKNMRRNRTRQV